MTKTEKFKEYIWLVNTISKKPLTLEEINELWVDTEMSGGVPMARNTFLRHKAAVEDMFGLYIECDRKNGFRYYIGNEYVLQENSVQNWLLSTLTVSNLISESIGLQERVLLEHVYTDAKMLGQVIQAMKGGRRIELHYRGYKSQETKTYRLSPYCLKLWHQRWYMLGRHGKDEYRIFAFDRMQRIKVLEERFTMDEYFDAADFFSESFGVVIGDGSPCRRIMLRAFGWERFAMRDLPLHHTQRMIAEGDDYTDFELSLRPTSDFKAHLLSRGRWLKVLQPTDLAEEIRQLHLEAAAESF